jgi:hypothetical protein
MPLWYRGMGGPSCNFDPYRLALNLRFCEARTDWLGLLDDSWFNSVGLDLEESFSREMLSKGIGAGSTPTTAVTRRLILCKRQPRRPHTRFESDIDPIRKIHGWAALDGASTPNDNGFRLGCAYARSALIKTASVGTHRWLI